MSPLRKFSALILFAAIAMGASAQLTLKINRQTVSNNQLTIVGLTDPDATVTVDDQPIHVYKSGSFGVALPCETGNASHVVVAKKGKEAKSVTVKPSPTKKEGSSTPQPSTKKISPLAVQTTEGAYLQYGDAGDRLGASKMGYLDAGIQLKAIAENNDLYLVNLSSNRTAYIPKEYVRVLRADPEEKAITSGNISISNIGRSDRVFVRMPSKVAYRSFTTINPQTICVEVFSTRCNSNWITHKDGLEIIDFVDFNQIESDVMQINIHLKSKANWGYSLHYDNSGLAIDVKHQPSKKLADLTIGLDAGHGGKYPGAISNSGLTEKEINLTLIKLVKQRLEKKGAKVVLSRSDDSEVTMSARNAIFRKANVDLAISIHNNAGGSPLDEMGTSTYYKHTFCRPLASTMRRHLLSLGFKDFGLTGNFNFALCQPTDYPTTLLEVLFMSSLPDEEKLLDTKWQNRIADEVVSGIEEYIKTSTSK